MIMFFFFKQKTAYEMRISDWSSDVCSSDLRLRRRNAPGICDRQPRRPDARLPRRRPRADRRQGQQPKMESANGRGGDRRLDRRDLRAIARNGTMDPAHLTLPPTDRTSVGEGKSVSVRVDLGRSRYIKKKKTQKLNNR